MSEIKDGLHDKFVVTRTDGKSKKGEKHADCRYFVLDYDHDPFALTAMLAYADACEKERPELAKDLRVQVAALEWAESNWQSKDGR